MKPLRILHLPSDVGGNAWGLAQGERALGADSKVLVARTGWTRYPSDISLNLQVDGSSSGKLFKLAKTFLEIRDNYDVFHFNFGSSLIHAPGKHLNLTDLPFYPDRARIFVTYNGCDARQKDLTVQSREIAACHNRECYGGICNSGKLDQQRRAGIEKMARYARHMWALNPDLLNFLPPEKSSFLPYSVVAPGFAVLPPKTGGLLRIVHAPTERVTKGTDHLLAALQRLARTRGECFELVLVEGLPHEEAMKIVRTADLVVDQLLIGWYGGLAVEAMQMGKPVIARIAAEDRWRLPPAMSEDLDDAILHADPDSVYDVLLWCVEHRLELTRRAEAAHAYAKRWHDPKVVASITLQAYETL